MFYYIYCFGCLCLFLFNFFYFIQETCIPPSQCIHSLTHSLFLFCLHNTFLNSLKGFTYKHNRTHQLQVHILTRFEVSDYNSECDAVCRLLVQIRCGRKSKTRFHVFFLGLTRSKLQVQMARGVEHFQHAHHCWVHYSPVCYSCS